MSNEASIPNPVLKSLSILIGSWRTVGHHPYLPGKTLHGQASFEWIEGGAFLMLKTQTDEPEVPSGLSIIGSDNATGEIFMLYFDERRVSRKYNFEFKDNVWTWWRDTPEFSQRFTVEIVNQGRTMIGKGRMSKNGGPWEGDLELTYERI